MAYRLNFIMLENGGTAISAGVTYKQFCSSYYLQAVEIIAYYNYSVSLQLTSLGMTNIHITSNGCSCCFLLFIEITCY